MAWVYSPSNLKGWGKMKIWARNPRSARGNHKGGWFFSLPHNQICIYLLCVYEYFAYMHVCAPCVPVGFPENGVTDIMMWVLGIKPGSFETVTSALYHWAFSPAPRRPILKQRNKCWVVVVKMPPEYTRILTSISVPPTIFGSHLSMSHCSFVIV